MTEKQEIIINGVDVSGCDFLAKEDIYNSYSGVTTAYKGQCGCSDDEMCKDHRNCGYKKLARQLQRKTQECEQKEKELLSNEKIINKLMKEVDELKQECEKLKNQVDEDYNYYTTELKTLRDIISNKEKRNAALFLMSNRYRKALEEIERICLEDVHIFADGTELRYDSLDDILDIINKLKGGNDE